MSLFFTSGGGRLGNQLLNIIHLMALSYEHNIRVFKLNDLYISSDRGKTFFEVNAYKGNWKISKDNKNFEFFLKKLFLNIFLRVFHFYFFVNPLFKSYKIGSKKARPRFLIGKDIGFDFNLDKIIYESKKTNISISGWGLRDWNLVFKYKDKISSELRNICLKDNNQRNIGKKKSLFVHIRRSDFLDISDYKALNFSDEIWMKSILNICYKHSINKVIIFSDANIPNSIIKSLENKNISVIKPLENLKENFINLFINHLLNAEYILCNSSSLTLSFAFISHDFIYLPSHIDKYQKIYLKDAHKTFPSSINWL